MPLSCSVRTSRSSAKVNWGPHLVIELRSALERDALLAGFCNTLQRELNGDVRVPSRLRAILGTVYNRPVYNIV